jgi:hypothetical protein
MATKRTDPHRPGAIIPAEYEARVYYSLASGMMPEIGVDCTRPWTRKNPDGSLEVVTPKCPDSWWCCVASAHRKVKATWTSGLEPIWGSIGKCGVCGAHFNHGVVFVHMPTGDVVHMGHDCARKYELMFDLSAWEIEHGRAKAAAAKEIAREKNAKQRQSFLDKYPGLEEALEVEHHIIADIKNRFVTYRELSEKQIALVMKIADEVRNPKPTPPEDVKVPGPLGKTEFQGTIVSAKVHEGAWGSAWKITVKVSTEGGCWLAWGTAPRYLMDEIVKAIEGDPVRSRANRGNEIRDTLRGRVITLRAILERGSEKHFRFMKRPTVVITKKAS